MSHSLYRDRECTCTELYGPGCTSYDAVLLFSGAHKRAVPSPDNTRDKQSESLEMSTPRHGNHATRDTATNRHTTRHRIAIAHRQRHRHRPGLKNVKSAPVNNNADERVKTQERQAAA